VPILAGLLSLFICESSLAFQQQQLKGSRHRVRLMVTSKNKEEQEEKSSGSSNDENLLDDLTPPPINLKRDSILFSENPSTQARNNAAKDAWKFCQEKLPPVLTGIWPWRDPKVADSQPVGALYNMAFVRLPVVLLAVAYTKHHILDGHALIMDIGDGPLRVPPFLVYAIIGLVLA